MKLDSAEANLKGHRQGALPWIMIKRVDGESEVASVHLAGWWAENPVGKVRTLSGSITK